MLIPPSLILLLLCIQSTEPTVPAQEINLLYELYTLTDGPNWRWRLSFFGAKWNFSTSVINPCNTQGQTWQGITCSSSPALCQIPSCSIRSIHLENYDIHWALPADWSRLIALTELDLSHNHISGSLPQILPTSLVRLNFFENSLTGSLPSALSLLTQLTYFHLSKNRVTGSLPSSLLALPIRYFNVAMNLFTGTIPESVGCLKAVRDLLLYTNIFAGSLPTTLATLALVTRIDFSVNLFMGTLPREFGSLSQLSHLDLDYNLLVGTIPPSFGSLTSLTQLNLEVNRISGPIPPEFTNLKQLVILSLFSNSLSGSIPPMILPQLTWLELHFNRFTGPFPSSLTLSSSLEILSLQHNLLSSTIPCDFSSAFPHLSYLDLSFNFFSGWCPDANDQTLHQNLSSLLMTLILSENLFHGPVPVSLLSHAVNLETFSMNSNLLTGSIPTIFEIMPHLHRLDLSHNYLHHDIPSVLGNLSELNQLYLQNNHLTGPLSRLLWATRDRNLSFVNLDLSANKLSSTLPEELFLLPSLATLALTSNCFEGSFPLTLCTSSQLRVLSMDGLGAASHCNGHISVPYSNVELKNPMSGDLPHCIWDLPVIQIISISDNGLRGTLGTLAPDSALINLTLSHNHLTGTIPESFQRHEFVSLDLSYNKLTGSFSVNRSRSADTRIILEVNRLSGDLQYHSSSRVIANLTQREVLDVLNGNLFGCGGLPEEDVTSATYSCGSKTIDQAFIWLASVLALLISLIAFYATRRVMRHSSPPPPPPLSTKSTGATMATLVTLFPFIRYLAVLHGVSRADPSSSEPNTQHLPPEVVEISQSLYFLSSLEKTVGIIALACIFFSFPLYVLRSAGGEDGLQYSTHTNLYRWEWTAAYLTGSLPAGFLLLAWGLVICLFLYCRGKLSQLISTEHRHRSGRLSSHSLSTDSSSEYGVFSSSWQERYESLLYVSVNIVVMGTVNSLYILSTTQERSPTQQFLIRLSLALFNSFWSSICLPLLDISKQQSKRIKLIVIAINTIFIPCIVTALTSPSCYQVPPLSPHPPPPGLTFPTQGLIVPSDEITSTYVFRECLTYFYLSGQFFCGAFGFTEAFVTPFVPPFSYNYLCSSTLLAAYLPVYIYIYSIQIVLYPLATYLLSKYVPYPRLPHWVQAKLPGIIWPLHWAASEHLTAEKIQQQGQKLEIATARRLLKTDDLMTRYLQGVLVLITFGLCCPPLAMAIALSMYLSLVQLRCVIGRFVLLRHPDLIEGGQHHAPEALEPQSLASADASLGALKSGIMNLDRSFHQTAWIVVWTSCFFYVVLCWDIAGDEVGWERAVWVPLTAMGFIIGVSVFVKGRSYLLDRTAEAADTEASFGLEMAVTRSELWKEETDASRPRPGSAGWRDFG
jgi:Leucine-rich repeat (LRR) protein